MNKEVSSKVELLAPAGNIEKLKVAFLYGADAVYLGGKNYSLRANAKNFSIEDIKTATEFVHKYGGIEYSTNIMTEYAIKAKQWLNDVPPSDAKESLLAMVDYNTTRKK